MEVLKDLCNLLDVEKGETKADIVGHLVDFLKNPQPSGRKSILEKKTKKSAAKKTTGKKAAKKQKSAKQPRALTAFFRFSADHRSAIKEANPGFGVTEVGRELGVRWKALSEAEKKPYQDAYEAEKAKLATSGE